MLAIVVYAVVVHGASALSLDFLLKGAPNGIGPALVGTAEIVAIATADRDADRGPRRALPDRVRQRPRWPAAIRLALDLMNGLPSIIIGLFVFGLLVDGHQQSAFAGSVALAIIMLPLIARGSQEVLLLVPNSLREAADALGVSRWRTVLGGDPAQRARRDRHRDRARRRPRRRRDRAADPHRLGLRPHDRLAQPVRSAAEHPGDDLHALRRSATPKASPGPGALALVLLTFIMFASLGARALLARSKRKMTS